MRILFIVHQYIPEFAAGTELITSNLAKAAQAVGHQVDVLTCSLLSRDKWSGLDVNGMRIYSSDGVSIHATVGEDRSALSHLGFESDTMSETQVAAFLDSRPAYDVVHVTHSMRMLEAIELIQRRGIPYVLTLTDFYLLCYRINLVQLSGALCSGPAGGSECAKRCFTPDLDYDRLTARQRRMTQILQGAASVNACSDYVAQLVRQEHPLLEIRVIGHGIDLLKFDYSLRRRSGEEIVFGYVGTISDAKGVRVLVDAFARASPCNARLELVGPAYEADLVDTLRRIAEDNPRITIRDAVHSREVPATMSGFDVLCLPSLVPESFSLVLYEAFAAGVPCIVSDLGSPARVVRDAGCGETVAPGDVKAWSEAITRMSGQPQLIDDWREKLPLPRRLEEEGFLYSRIYRQVGEMGIAGVPSPVDR
jgi:glycosyltransferase involved in cell wall biosynthesis